MRIPKILLLMDPPHTQDVLRFNLEAKLGIELLDPRSEAEAVGMLVTDDEVELVVVDPAGGWGEFLKFSESSERKPRFVVISSPGAPALPAEIDIVEEIPKAKLAERLPVFLSSYLLAQREVDDEDPFADREYCRIKTQLLLEASPLKADVYIRLSEKKYVKLFLKGDSFDHADLEKYLETKQVRYLYLKTAESGEFVGKFAQILRSLLQSPSAATDAGATAAARALDTVQELGNKIGFTPEVENIFKTNVALVLKLVSANARIASLVADLMNNRTSYIATHSVALARVSCAIAAEMDWKSESTFQKLTTAAMMHDLILRNQALARIRSLTELQSRKGEFTPEEVAAYPNHPIQAADLARGFSDMPADVDQIIQQHHEQPDGRGFPKSLAASRISPLGSLFIVAHDLIDELFEDPSAFSIAKFIEDRKGIYESRNFKKVLQALPKARISFKG